MKLLFTILIIWAIVIYFKQKKQATNVQTNELENPVTKMIREVTENEDYIAFDINLLLRYDLYNLCTNVMSKHTKLLISNHLILLLNELELNAPDEETKKTPRFILRNIENVQKDGFNLQIVKSDPELNHRYQLTNDAECMLADYLQVKEQTGRNVVFLSLAGNDSSESRILARNLGFDVFEVE